MNSAQQITHALLERFVAMRASETACRPEIAESRRTESAARCIALRRLHLLVHALEEIAHIGLGRTERGFHPSLSGAPLAEVEQPHSTSLDLSELDDSVRFLANIAHHVIQPSFAGFEPATTESPYKSYDYITNNGFGQPAALEQQHSPRSRGETPVMSDDDHTDLEVIYDLHQ